MIKILDTQIYTKEQLLSHRKLGYKTLNELIANYQKDIAKGIEQSPYLDQIMIQFHGYIEKYVDILHYKGANIDYTNMDTRKFISLFSAEDAAGTTLKAKRAQLVRLTESLSDVDIYNELVAIFIKIIQRYDSSKNVNAQGFVITQFRWRVKDWVLRLKRHVNHLDVDIDTAEYNPEFFHIFAKSDKAVQGDASLISDLNIRWLDDPGNEAFKKLSRYHRYLLFLRYGEDMPMTDIAKFFGKNKDTVFKHIKTALNSIRKSIGEER